jgi:hypothetical protein
MSTYSWQDAEAVIALDLKKLRTDGGSGNFMIVSADDIYVQFACSRGSSQIHCEAVGNDYLDRQHRLPPEKVDELEKLHFDLQDEPANFVREFEVASEEHARELARLGLDILERIYGCARTSRINIELTLE